MTRQYLQVPFREKDDAKRLGARFDWDRKLWYVEGGINLTPFARWLPADLALTPSVDAKATAAPSFEEDNVAANGISLSQLLAQVKNAVHAAVPSGVWTLIELTEVHDRHHIFLDVAERDAAGRERAKARAIIWASTAQKVLPEFERLTGQVLAAGMKLLVRATHNFHEQYGFSLFIDAIDAEFMLGQLEAKRREIRARLQREGVYTNNRQLPAPWAYGRLLVVTPDRAAGLGDFQKEANRLHHGGVCFFHYEVSRFQGAGAAEEVIAAIDTGLQAMGKTTPPDAIILIRGGGAVADLVWLEEYALVRFICDLPIPVYTGIGHERDKTLLDEVAHTAFDTPSKVIAGIENQIRQQVAEVKQFMQTLVDKSYQQLHRLRLALESDHAAVQTQARQHVYWARGESQRQLNQIQMAATQQIGMMQRHLPLLFHTVYRQTHNASYAQYHALNYEFNRLGERASTVVSRARDASQALFREIMGQGPDKTLARGFVIAYTPDNKPVSTYTQAKLLPYLQLQFQDGTLRVRRYDDQET